MAGTMITTVRGPRWRDGWMRFRRGSAWRWTAPRLGRCARSACAPGRAATCWRCSPGIPGETTSGHSWWNSTSGNADAARARARAAGLERVEIVTSDAALTDNYRDMAPADLVLVCGVFGNITLGDIERTVGACCQLCKAGGTVIWTRSRAAPDRVPLICEWLYLVGSLLRPRRCGSRPERDGEAEAFQRGEDPGHMRGCQARAVRDLAVPAVAMGDRAQHRDVVGGIRDGLAQHELGLVVQ